MKLVKTATLIFTEGRSDKVYEVDLCEVGAGKYVVNIRYGRRGTTLKDGSKTPLPVSQAEAERIYDKTITHQREKGYLTAGEPRPAPLTPVAAASAPDRGSNVNQTRRQRIVARLAAPDADRQWFQQPGQEKPWNLERAIWRAGELRVQEAEPYLLRLIGTAPANAAAGAGGHGMRDYCIAWALGRMGGPDSMQPLTRLFGDARAPEHVKRMATLALQSLSDEKTNAAFAEHLIGQLPAELQAPARGEDPHAFSLALRSHLQNSPPSAFAVVDTAYVINSSTVRAGILQQLANVELKAPFFRSVRHIFKAAEYRRDGQVFGVLAHRFEKTRANPAPYYYQQSETARTAFRKPTRAYLRRRVWRTLRRLGQLGDTDYVNMAVGVLLPFTDADAVQATPDADRWAPYWAFNQILYAHSPRYEPAPNGKCFRCRRGVRPDAPPPPMREEAFPTLWEAKPQGLMHLLVESSCTPVHEMAAKAIRACPAFLDQLDVEEVVLLLGRPYEVTARLALELAEKRYQPDAPNLPLLLAMATCSYAPARAKAHQWIDEQRTRIVTDSAFLAALVVARHEDTRAFARRLLKSQALGAEVAAPLVARIVAAMLALGSCTEDDLRARGATQTLVDTLATHLSAIQDGVVNDLLAHPASGVQELGAELLLRRATGRISDELLVKVLHSPHENVRAVGLRLLAELPEDALDGMELLLVRLCTDKNADLRNASRPVVVRVSTRHRPVGETIVNALVLALIRNKLPEGAPSHVLRLLKGELWSLAQVLPTTDVWRLLQSGSSHAQELGWLLLQHHNAADFSLDQMVGLASHEVLSIRQAAWSFLERSLDRVRSQMAEASRILDAKWEDSRQFAFQFFREKLGADAFHADVLVTILDSVRDDVQAFGRELTTRYFREEDGPELMEKLSEHPQVSVQLFVTNYLERYAGNPRMLERLVPYFRSVLSRVNQGRIAKQRVLSFLETQGAASPEAARLVVDILHGLSATIAVEYRGAALAAMMSIHHAQPSIPLPLRIKPPIARGAHGVPVRVQG